MGLHSLPNDRRCAAPRERVSPSGAWSHRTPSVFEFFAENIGCPNSADLACDACDPRQETGDVSSATPGGNCYRLRLGGAT
jgi:hypothetical protein